MRIVRDVKGQPLHFQRWPRHRVCHASHVPTFQFFIFNGVRFFTLVVLATFGQLFGVEDEAAIVFVFLLSLWLLSTGAAIISAIYSGAVPFHLDHRPAF